MARFCTSCGSPLDDAAVFCSKCGKGSAGAGVAGSGAAAAPAAAPVVSATNDNTMGALAYLTILPAIYFLVTAPYNTNRFIRFHSFQSILLCVAAIIIDTVVWMLPIINIFLGPLLGLAFLLIWLFTMFKAYSGQTFKLPVIGDIAEKQANA